MTRFTLKRLVWLIREYHGSRSEIHIKKLKVCRLPSLVSSQLILGATSTGLRIARIEDLLRLDKNRLFRALLPYLGQSVLAIGAVPQRMDQKDATTRLLGRGHETLPARPARVPISCSQEEAAGARLPLAHRVLGAGRAQCWMFGLWRGRGCLRGLETGG